MKQNIWILNHYAGEMYINNGGRHYWFAKYLKEYGYNPTIFCANTIHGFDKKIEIGKSKWITSKDIKSNENEISFVFVKSSTYHDNGLSRIRNMLSFTFNLLFATRQFAQKYHKPDVILASSVHPLTLWAGLKIAKRYKVPCICEVRDLWPESLVAYGMLKKNSLLAKILYAGEKWIYKKADAIVMTWQGGAEYMKERGMGKDIYLSKVTHINNGVDLKEFDYNANKFVIKDGDLDSSSYKNIVYAGSIRKVNNIGFLLDTAKLIKKKGITDIKFLIYGDGNEKEDLERRCIDESIDNVKFKGLVKKKYVPYILGKAYVNILHNKSTALDKYGQSQNKFFEYLAAGRCIIQTYTTGYSICDRLQCGICLSAQTPEELSKVLMEVCDNKEKVECMGINARESAKEYDFSVLTNKLISVIEELIG